MKCLHHGCTLMMRQVVKNSLVDRNGWMGNKVNQCDHTTKDIGGLRLGSLFISEK